MQSLIEYFYAIPGVPSKAVKPAQMSSGPGLRQTKIFIQSTSQGSRSLKAGTKILYLKEVYFLHCMHAYYDIVWLNCAGIIISIYQLPCIVHCTGAYNLIISTIAMWLPIRVYKVLLLSQYNYDTVPPCRAHVHHIYIIIYYCN